MIQLYKNKEQCCGCTACKNICPRHAITMKSDEEGFLYPIIDKDKCIKCKLCKKVCNFQKTINQDNELTNQLVYAVKHKDEKIRRCSTSGGVFTAISDNIFDNNGIVYGAAYNSNMVVCHQRANNKEERNKFRGSKYVQSDLKNTFKEVKELLKEDKHVLFTGTPCQIDGLNSYLKNINSKKLITCDIVCHGVPSPLIFKNYIELSEQKNKDKIINYYCRDKVNGWHSHTERAIYISGRQDYKSSTMQIYKTLFFSHNILRPSCHKCKYTNLNRCSDITIADFWGIEKSLPEFDDNKGVSLVLVNSDKGREMFGNIKKDINYKVSGTKECLQPQLQYPSRVASTRDEFWEDYKNKGFKFVAKKYGRYNVKNRLKFRIKGLLK